MGVTPHTSCHRGKRVLVRLKNGVEFIGKFFDKDGRFVYFNDGIKVKRGDIERFTIYKPSL